MLFSSYLFWTFIDRIFRSNKLKNWSRILTWRNVNYSHLLKNVRIILCSTKNLILNSLPPFRGWGFSPLFLHFSSTYSPLFRGGSERVQRGFREGSMRVRSLNPQYTHTELSFIPLGSVDHQWRWLKGIVFNTHEYPENKHSTLPFFYRKWWRVHESVWFCEWIVMWLQLPEEKGTIRPHTI